MSLSNTEILLIRACKSAEPLSRLRSVYKHQYGRYDNMDASLVGILTGIIDEKFPMNTFNLVTELAPCNDYRYEGKTFAERVLTIYIHHFRYMDVNKLEGMVLPLKHRNTNSW